MRCVTPRDERRSTLCLFLFLGAGAGSSTTSMSTIFRFFESCFAALDFWALSMEAIECEM